MQTQDVIYFSILALIVIIYWAGLWKIFEKAGEKGWKAIIPVYNTLTILKIIGKPASSIFILLIPGINIVYFIFGILVELYRSFGKEKLSQQLIGIFFYFAYVAYLGFSPDEKYIGPASKIPKPAKSQAREWADAIVFAVIAATIIRWLLLEAFKIPTPSMERTLLMGDFLFVSKVHYGTRTPQTPLQIPLTHQYLWGSETVKSYSDLIQLPQYRLPGLSKVKNYDVVVFNYPADPNHKPVDLKTNYIKRCIGIGGDTLQIINKKVYINSKLQPFPTKAQFAYKVFTSQPISNKIFDRYEIPNYMNATGDYRKDYYTLGEGKYLYIIELTPELAVTLQEKGIADSCVLTNSRDAQQRQALFPLAHGTENWTIDDYGPLWIPKKGAKISMNPKNVAYYESTIRNYEEHDKVEARDGKLFIDGKEVTEYTFTKDYYFMMGDNRHNSLDSRFWGFVPENYIVGKALFIWFSMDPDPKKRVFESIRWDRIFNGIK